MIEKPEIELRRRLDAAIQAAVKSDKATFRELAVAAELDLGRDFRGANLRGVDLRDENLAGFDFTEADLTGADFRRADIRRAVFARARLEGTIGIDPNIARRQSRTSYLAPYFEPDVYVSYAHGDSIGGRAPLRDWTQAVVERLRETIVSLETEFDNLHIWMDPEIDPTAFLTADLKARVGACGVLIIVMSKRYLTSSWCRDELDWFGEQVERRRNRGRLIILRAQPTDPSSWPDFLRDRADSPIPGFQFYDQETGVPLDYPDLKERSAEFGRELLRLDMYLVKRLRELRQRADKAERDDVARPEPHKPRGVRLIYLHAPPRDEAAVVEIGQALKADGIAAVIRAVRATEGTADSRKEAKLRIEAVKRCEALVLLRVGNDERFVGDLLEIGVQERERVAYARGAPLPCAVLDVTGRELPIDLSALGIERFDVNEPDWRSRFLSWIIMIAPGTT